jgi:hypothetical protein
MHINDLERHKFVLTADGKVAIRVLWGAGGDMMNSENLSELTDFAAARDNLDVYSRSEADALNQRVPIRVKYKENITKWDLLKLVPDTYVPGEAAVGVEIAGTGDIVFCVAEKTGVTGDIFEAINTWSLYDINTDAYNPGDIFYWVISTGTLTTTEPTSWDYQTIGYVTRDHASHGVVFYELSAPHFPVYSKAEINTALLWYAVVGHDHAGVYEPVFSKNTAFNKNFGTTAGTVLEWNRDALYEKIANKGQASGYAPLDSNSLIPSIYLPSFVDDVIDIALYANLPATGEAGKIYNVYGDTISLNGTYRWGGAAYSKISSVSDAVWGHITWTLADQTDLVAALAGKSDTSHTHTFASITSKPTTLAGYGITDAMTSSAITSALNGKATLSGGNVFTGTQTLNAISWVGGNIILQDAWVNDWVLWENSWATDRDFSIYNFWVGTVLKILKSNGNVGIGTTPWYKLDVSWDMNSSWTIWSNWWIRVRWDGADSQFRRWLSTEWSYWIFQNAGAIIYAASWWLAIWLEWTNSVFKIATWGAWYERFKILENGNIGIWITPTEKLDIDWDVRFRGFLKTQDTWSWIIRLWWSWSADDKLYVQFWNAAENGHASEVLLTGQYGWNMPALYIKANFVELAEMRVTWSYGANFKLSNNDSAQAFRFQDANNVTIMEARHSGQVLMPSLPTSSSWLPSGSLWRNGTVVNIVA